MKRGQEKISELWRVDEDENDEDEEKKTLICDAIVPPQTIAEWDAKGQRFFQEFGMYFKNREESELFMMLPIADKHKPQLLATMIEATGRLTDEIKTKLRNSLKDIKLWR